MNKIIFETSLSLSSRLVLLSLNHFLENGVQPTTQKLANSLGLSNPSIFKALRDLEELGFISISKETKNNNYQILI